MLYPWMLLGLLGLSVPIILHLIQRQRLRTQPLATLHFLDVEDAANAFAPVPRDWLQLLLRLMLLGLFVLLMTRMTISRSEVGPRTLAVVLDQSLSMQRKVGEQQSLFDRHKANVLKLIDGMGPEDRMALFLVGDQVTKKTGYLQDRDELRKTAEAFQVSDGGSQAVVPAVRGVIDQLATRHEVNAAVLVFSDHQRSHFQSYLDEAKQGGNHNPTLAFHDRLEAGTVKLFLVDELVPAAPNLAIEDAHFTPAQVHAGESSRLTAVVRNHSTEKQTARVQAAALGEAAGKPRELTLEPGEAAHIDLVQRFNTNSACRVEIESDNDKYPGDDRFFLPMRLRPSTKILLVTPTDKSEPQDRTLEVSHRAVDLLSYALNPGQAPGLARLNSTSIDVRRVAPVRLSQGQESLITYSIIILYGVDRADLESPERPNQTARDLEAFLNNGGGLWIVPGLETSPLRFNEGYADLLHGFAIGQLKQPEPVQALGKDEAALASPLLVPLLREEWGSTRDTYFSRYHAVQAPGNAQVALRSANGDPLAVMLPQKRGRVFVQLFGAGLESSSLPRTSAFVPLVQQVAAGLQPGEPARPDALRVGEGYRMNLPDFRGKKEAVTVQEVASLDERNFPLTGPDASEVRIEGLLRAGAYEVTHPTKARRDKDQRKWISSTQPRFVTVNPVLGESDPVFLGDNEQTVLFGTANVKRVPFDDLGEQFARRHEVFALMIVLVFVLFVIEALAGAWQARRKLRPDGAGGRAA